MIGKIQRASLREVWEHEARDFTPWLEDNLDVLNDILDITLCNAEREQSAGVFSVDLVATDDSGNRVIIENQLEKSDHDHLGKLITYLTAIGAVAAVWIVAEPRPEHVNAVSWLNESSTAAFYLLKVEAIRIGDSPPAPLLTLIVGPSEAVREIGKTKKELADGRATCRQFSASLLAKAKLTTKLHAGTSPRNDGWLGANAGKRGLVYNYRMKRDASAAELSIDRGRDSATESKAIYNQLLQSRKEIEHAFGSTLEWESRENRLVCRIWTGFQEGGYGAPEDRWPQIQTSMIDAMMRLEKALRPHIEELSIGT